VGFFWLKKEDGGGFFWGARPGGGGGGGGDMQDKTASCEREAMPAVENVTYTQSL